MTLVDRPRSFALFTTLLVAIGVLMIPPGSGRAADEAIVQTVSGAVSGSGGEVRSFKGIPFAAPPVGGLRFTPPRPPAAWTGVRDATVFGPGCMQPTRGTLRLSEDCLTLNVWTAAKRGEHLPVMVWIYGGGFAVGSADNAVFNDATPLTKHGVVVVTFNYRLGPFGFLALPQLTAESPEHTSGNYGILDQMAALRWVQQNIAAFGGDPRNVTVFGDSAGSESIVDLLTSPRAAMLFGKAILESPPVLRPQLSLAQAEDNGTHFAAGLDLAALRALPAADVLRRVPALDPDTRADQAIAFGPIADGVILASERTSFNDRTARAVPTILGNNAAEGMFFAPNVPVKTLDEYRLALQKRFGNAAAEAATLWPASTDAEAHVAESLIVGDIEINASARRLARLLAARGVPVYRYVFTKDRAGKLPGHTEEQPYVWGAPAVSGLGQPAPPFDAGDQRVSDLMLGAWTQFAKTGNPNGPGLAPWPRYDVPTDRFVVFADPATVGTSFRTTQMDFIARTIGR